MSIINNGDKVGVKKLQRKRICGQCGFMTENTCKQGHGKGRHKTFDPVGSKK